MTESTCDILPILDGVPQTPSIIRAAAQQEMRNEIRDLRENYAHIIEKIQYLDLKLGIVLAQQNLTHTRLQALEYGKIPELEREEKQNGKHRHNG